MKQIRVQVKIDKEELKRKLNLKDGYTPVKNKDYFDGEPGRNYILTSADKKEIAEKIKVPVVEKVIEKTEVIHEKPVVKEVAVPDTGEEMIKKINKDKSKQKIRKEKVEGLKEIGEEIKTLQTDVSRQAGFFTKFAGDTVLTSDLSDQLNGVLKTFTLPANARVRLVIGSSNPYIFRPTTDYTVSGGAITFTSEIDAAIALDTGQSLLILYIIP